MNTTNNKFKFLPLLLVSFIQSQQELFIPEWCSEMCKYPPIEIRYCFKEAYGLSATIFHVNKGDELASGEVMNNKDSYEYRYLAVSQDLLEEFPFGAIVYIVGSGKFDGYWKVKDTMLKKYARRIHFLVNDDVTVGQWDDIAMYCVETPDLYN
ncbi:hypothetical protein OA490_01625 [Flavobacteriales bacterium]|nr:hypothetical protein [Flavobacteriales bacterium]